jgi:hypothetical protein
MPGSAPKPLSQITPESAHHSAVEVFISWSGKRSEIVAKALKIHLPDARAPRVGGRRCPSV